MKIGIIEDEYLVAEELADTLKEARADVEILCKLGSVKEAVYFFNNTKELPDVLFCDIQLGDGLSFDIVKQVTLSMPIIFCTAFDEYMMEAFETNGIAYILKPFTKQSIQKALLKYESLQKAMLSDTILSYDLVQRVLTTMRQKERKNVMVKYRDRLLPFSMDQIAMFYIEEGVTNLHTFQGEVYTLSETLDELEIMTSPVFFRVNRQFLINRLVVLGASNTISRKVRVNVSIEITTEITVSREKKIKFLEWLKNS